MCGPPKPVTYAELLDQVADAHSVFGVAHTYQDQQVQDCPWLTGDGFHFRTVHGHCGRTRNGLAGSALGEKWPRASR